MGVLGKLTSSLGLKHFAASKASSKYNAGYATEMPQSSQQINTMATYLVPGSALVQVSGQSMKTIASLQPGEKILSTDVMKGGAFIWASVEDIEAAPVTTKSKTVELGLGETAHVLIDAEQVILVKDRKKRMTMQTVRRLQVGPDSAVVYNADGLQWRSKKAQEVKKISSLRVSREQESTEGLYKVTVGSTNHALLVSYEPNPTSLLVVNSTNSTVDLKVLAAAKKPDDSDVKMNIKNTFIEMEVGKEADDEQMKGVPRSYSDSDIQRLAVELELDDPQPRIVGKPLFSQDELDLTSNATSKTRNTLSSTASSIMAKSILSSESGGSIDRVRVGTQPIVAEDGHQGSIATREIKFSHYETLPLNEDGLRTSAATDFHLPGRKSKCRKCAFYNTFSFKKGKICKNGALCDFCHGSHDRFIHRR